MRWWLVFLIGCSGPREPIAPLPQEPVSPPDAAFLREVPRLSVFDDVLCMDDDCRRIDDGNPKTVTIVDARKALRPDPPLPMVAANARQLSFAHRVGCALTDKREVWCWSDPAHPRKLAATDVEQIAVLDPLALCVRTTAGDVACTPPIASAGFVYCHLERNECRLRAEMDQPRGPAFDPVEPLLRPLVSERLPFAAREFVRDEYAVQPIVPDYPQSMYSDQHVGGCILGAAGEVACFHSCDPARATYRVTMPPVVTIRSDRATGYGVTENGELWTWPRLPDECTRDGTVEATRAELPAIAQLAPLLHFDGRKKFGTDIRCVAQRDGDVRCWEPKLGLGARFDPKSPTR